MQCAPWASNGPNRLGLCVLQAALFACPLCTFAKQLMCKKTAQVEVKEAAAAPPPPPQPPPPMHGMGAGGHGGGGGMAVPPIAAGRAGHRPHGGGEGDDLGSVRARLKTEGEKTHDSAMSRRDSSPFAVLSDCSRTYGSIVGLFSARAGACGGAPSAREGGGGRRVPHRRAVRAHLSSTCNCFPFPCFPFLVSSLPFLVPSLPFFVPSLPFLVPLLSRIVSSLPRTVPSLLLQRLKQCASTGSGGRPTRRLSSRGRPRRGWTTPRTGRSRTGA